jgi:beta-xylosidase
MRTIFLLFAIAFAIKGYAQMNGHWGDQGDGTFRNPVIAADYSDPDPLRVGDDYYLVSSTFESYPGVTILHSKDLVNWNTIGAALTDLASVSPAYTAKEMNRYNDGVYAPTISYHNGRYYIYVNLYSDGFYVAMAEDPAGPWKGQFVKDKNGRPLRVRHWTDPCPFWDDDGKAYLVTSHPGRKYWYSYMFQMSEDGTTLLDADSAHMSNMNCLYQYPDGGTVISPFHSSEGNRIFKRNGYYYLQHIEFTNLGQGEGTYVFRSRNLYGTLPDGKPGYPGHPGKYEVFQVERVRSRDSLRVPGQGGYVDTPDGRWYWIGQFTRNYACGRPPVLLPVTWVDDWPVIGVNIKDMKGLTAWRMNKPIQGYSMAIPQGSDEFSSHTLQPYWMWNHVPDSTCWSLTDHKGCLRLYAAPTLRGQGFFKASNTLCQRYMHSQSTYATTCMETSEMANGQRAGLAHFNGGKSYAFIAVDKDENGYSITVESNGNVLKKNSLGTKVLRIYLRTTVDENDSAKFLYSLDGKRFADMGYIYHLVPGNFRGDMIGLFTYNDTGKHGYVDFDWFDYQVSNK